MVYSSVVSMVGLAKDKLFVFLVSISVVRQINASSLFTEPTSSFIEECTCTVKDYTGIHHLCFIQFIHWNIIYIFVHFLILIVVGPVTIFRLVFVIYTYKVKYRMAIEIIIISIRYVSNNIFVSIPELHHRGDIMY